MKCLNEHQERFKMKGTQNSLRQRVSVVSVVGGVWKEHLMYLTDMPSWHDT